jgi:hypothetical protein
MSGSSVPQEFPVSKEGNAVSGDLERRYRRALRLLPGYYRKQWEEDMVAAFLDSSLTGDPEEDEFIIQYGKPSGPELASVAGLAVRLYLGGAGAPRRYFTWGQAVRGAVLAMTLARATQALGSIAVLAWEHHLFGLPAPPAQLVPGSWDAVWATTWYVVGYAWIVAYIALVRGYYRTAQVIAVLAIAPDLVYLRHYPGWWTWWILFYLVPVLAMAAFHSGAPPVTRRNWLFALPVSFALVAVPVIALQATGNAGWLDQPGLYCILVTIACLAHAVSARARRGAGPDEWSLALILLAAAAGAYQAVALLDDPHLLTAAATATSKAGLPELLVLAAAVAADGHSVIGAWKPRGPRQAAWLLAVLGVAAGVITLAAVGRLNSGVTFGRHSPPPGQAASAIVVTPMVSRPKPASGSCPAGYLAISVPGADDSGLCFRQDGPPVTFMSAEVTWNPGDAGYQFLVTLPAGEAAALKAVTTTAYDAQGFTAIIVDAKTWEVARVYAPLTKGQFVIQIPDENAALQLQQILAPPA